MLVLMLQVYVLNLIEKQELAHSFLQSSALLGEFDGVDKTKGDVIAQQVAVNQPKQ